MTKPNKKYIKTIRVVERSLNALHQYLKIVVSIGSGSERPYTCLNDSDWLQWTTSFLNEFKNTGPEETIKLFKKVKRVGICLSLGSPFEVIPFRKTFGENIPELLRPLYKFLTGTPEQKRVALTALNIVETLYLPASQDFSAITDQGVPVTNEFLVSFRAFVKRSKLLKNNFWKSSKSLTLDRMHFSNKAGPNGPALREVHNDVVALLRSPKLCGAVSSLLEKSCPSGDYAFSLMKDEFSEFTEDYKSFPTSYTGKVSQLCEGGGKTRNIAIVDFWSQNALKGIHDLLMGILRKMRTDSTYNQDDGFRSAMIQANHRGCCFSFDLSSATDRFPLSIQLEVAKQLLGEEIADLWSSVIADREFKHPAGQGTLRWARGQPLGALSSWAMFALTHHLFIKFCAGRHDFQDYRVLGDDVMIFDKKVADEYLRLMNEIGVVVNLTKSFVSHGPVVFGEFAKRVFLGPNEVTGLPLKLILEARRSIYSIPEFLGFLSRRWDINLSDSTIVPETFQYLTSKGLFLLNLIWTSRSFQGTTQIPLTVPESSPWRVYSEKMDLRSRFVDFAVEAFQIKLTKAMRQFSTYFPLPDSYEVVPHIPLKGTSKWIADVESLRGRPVVDRIFRSFHLGNHPLRMCLDSLRLLLRRSGRRETSVNDLTDLEVRFVPDLTLASFFQDRQVQRSRSRGSLVLSFFNSLSRT